MAPLLLFPSSSPSTAKYQSIEPSYIPIDPGTTSSKDSDFESDDTLTEFNLLGPFKNLLRISGLDCSSSQAPKSCFSRILAILIIIILFIKCMIFFNIPSRTMSVQWAESNMFAFMSIHSIISAFCLFTWTKNGFVANHLERLEVVRKLRMSNNHSLNDYSSLHKKSFIWAGLWFLCIMTHSITSTLFQRVLLTTEPQPSLVINIFLPVATFLSCLAVTLCLIIYVLVNCSLTRELQQFNGELEEVVGNGGFEDVAEMFSNRQAELIKVVRKANDSLEKYAGPGPIFCFFGLINGVYIVSFLPQLSTLTFIILILNLIAIIALTIFTLRPPSNLQAQIADTSRILLESGELKSSELYCKTMIDRALKTDTRLRAAGGIPICHNSMMVSLLVLPNLGNVLGVIKNVLAANGLQI